jgi:arsenical pump membrane protein
LIGLRLRLGLVVLGAGGVVVAAVLARPEAGDSLTHTWPPFVLVTGLLMIGVVASEDGLFAVAARFLARLPGNGFVLYVAAMLLVVLVTVFLNLDTSVAFLTPILVYLARHRRVNEQQFLYGCVFMSNAASLLLPGSNLTNLLVLANEHVSGAVFLQRMWLPWLAAVGVTMVVVAIAFRGDGEVTTDLGPEPEGRLRALSIAGVAVAIVVILAVADSAVPVFAIGVLLVIFRWAQGRLRLRAVGDGVDAISLATVFLVAVALGAVARTWSYPGNLMMGASSVGSAAIGAVASVLVNNLPAAVLLGSRLPAHPRSLLLGLDIGPNLAVTGSLSALIWWQSARSASARPSAIRYSMVGVVLVPLTIGAALAVGGIGG